MNLALFMHTTLKNYKAFCYMLEEHNFVLLVINAMLYIYLSIVKLDIDA